VTSRSVPDLALRRVISLEPRACDCCDGQNLESLWAYDREVRTRNGWFVFQVNIVVCRGCGFVFVSPVFNETDLHAYYSDSHSSFEMQVLDYDPAIRLAFLDRMIGPGGTFVEVGAHQSTLFHDELGRRFDTVTTLDLNESLNRDRRTLPEIDDAVADVVAHYFVLEHVPRAVPFLRQCARILKPGGVMVVEVPDIVLYPHNATALQLHEHTSHFSAAALQTVARRAGFELIGDCVAASRVIGFAAAFRKTSNEIVTPAPPNEYAINKAHVLQGLQVLAAQAEFWTQTAKQMKALHECGQPLVLWAANDALAAFLRAHPQPPETIVIDSDEGKRFFLDGHEVVLPVAAVGHILAASAIFIFTRNHAYDILASIEREFGRRFDREQVHVVDLLGTMELGGAQHGFSPRGERAASGAQGYSL